MGFFDAIQKNNTSSVTKSAYQQLFSQPVKQEWKVGDQPTNYGQALATINAMYKTNPTGAQEKLTLLNQYRTQPGNKWYDAYAAPTNKDVDTLKSYGIDPTELTSDWFNANNGWQAYLKYNGTTNTPSKPTKKSTEQEKMAYALYQFQKSMGDTTSAKDEWLAAQDEINYWVNRKDLNMSDDDIINKVFGSNKYKTLKKMDDTRSNGSPLELNEAIDYNPDSVRGVIWAARNNGGTGNSRQDIANYYSRVGNNWVANDEISAKLNKADLSTYSPHEIGMTGSKMDDVGAYFGKSSFAPGEIEELRSNVDWDDATSVKMFQTGYEAEQDTLEAEKELAEFTKAFQKRLNRGFADQNAADKWIDEMLNESDYKMLAKMDSGLMKGEPMNMTRAVPYRKQMFQQAAYDSIANPKKSGSEIMESYGIQVTDAEKSTVKAENENVISAIDAMAKFLTTSEEDYFNAAPGIEYVALVNGMSGIKGAIEANAGNFYGKASNEYAGSVLNAIPTVNQYEQYKSAADRLNASVTAYEQEHANDALAAAEIDPEVNVRLSNGSTAQFTYNEQTNQYEWSGLTNEDIRRSATLEDAQAVNEEVQQILSKANERLQLRAGLDSATPESIEQFEQYKKDKDQLNVINKWLDQNKEAYDVAFKSVEESKAKRDAIGQIAAKFIGAEYDPSVSDSIIDYAGAMYQYQGPVADGITLIEESAGKSADEIQKEISDNDASIKDVQYIMSVLGDNIPDELKQKMNAFISEGERQNRIYNDYLITQDPKFEEYVNAGKQWDTIYNPDDTPVGGEVKNWFGQLSEEERNIYFALVGMEQDWKTADQFYKDIRDELIQRQENKINNITTKISESGALGRFLSEAGAILLSPINTMANTAYSVGVALGYDEAEAKAAKLSSHVSSSQHNANINELKKIYGEDTALGKVLSGVYEIMYNRGNSLLNALTWGKLMPSLGGDGKVVDFINNVISATPIALSAASDALENAIDRGANPTQQAIIFASTLIAESWTEGIEFGNIEKNSKLLLTKNGFMQFLKAYPAEALSEVIGESLNDVIENKAGNEWAKLIENPNYESEHEAAVKRYLAEDDTLTPEQAEAKVYQDEIAGVLHTAIISAFSPGADVFSMAANTVKTYNQYAQEAKAYNETLQPQVRQTLGKSIRDIRLEHEAEEAARNNPQPVVEETVSEPVQETTETQPEAAAPVVDTAAEAAETYDKGIILLEEAADANATAKTAAIASAINTGNQYMAQAAATKLDLVTTQGIMIAGRSLGINPQTISTGLQFAALGNGACTEVLNNGMADGLGIYGMAEGLAVSVDIDLANEAVMKNVSSGIHDARVSEEFKRLMAGLRETAASKPTNADEAMQKLSAKTAVDAMDAIDQARVETATAEQLFEMKQNELVAAQQGVSEAAVAVAEDPINDGNQMTAALSKMMSASAVAQEYAQKLKNAQENQKTVEEKNLKLVEDTTAKLRQEAENTVVQQENEEAVLAQEEAAARAAAEQEQREQRNVTELGVEDFINRFFPDATEEDKQNIRDSYARIRKEFIDRARAVKEAGKESAQSVLDRKNFVNAISKKFNVAINVGDTTFGGTRPYKNAQVDTTTGEILIDTNATQDDIMYAVLAHELTHIAEKSGTYDDLASAILQIVYNDQNINYRNVIDAMNAGTLGSQIAADIMVKKNTYDTTLGRDHSYEAILQEIVADGMGQILSGDQNLINRLAAEKPSVAKRLINSIKSFLKKLTGVQGAPISQAQKVVDMLETALNESTKVMNQKANGTEQQTLDYEIRKSEFSDNPVVRMNGHWSDAVDAALKSIGMTPYKDGYGWGFRLKKGVKLTADQIRTAIENADKKNSIPESKPIVTDANGDEMAVELPGGSINVSPNLRFSLNSLDKKEQANVVKALTESGRFTPEEVSEYLKNALGIASVIAADRHRLDYNVTDPDKSAWKDNSDYGGTIDMSTLCAKRLVYQGTFDAIQHLLPNTALMPEDLIHLSDMMREMGYETPCGLCYVESRRKNLDSYIADWLKNYKGDDTGYIPTIADVSTTDGLEEVRKNHPKAYEDFMYAMKHDHGTQGNPKVVQLRTEYKGEIRTLSKTDIQKFINHGGIRLQSFSDFETPHLLDMIQVTMDIAAMNMTSQAYTKVPNFPWVFGDTGIKINLSLIGKGEGVDENGKLIFDDVEGMPYEEAIALRNRYSKNVGTILVGMNDKHILAAMADPTIDYIIPFHRSGWKNDEIKLMHTLEGYKDYTRSQNERDIKTGKKAEANLEPVGENGYWDFNKSGKENAEAYLDLCAENGLIPKFDQFLEKRDGRYYLKSDGTTDGYWKLLIDFKMYDNDGVGSPQTLVTPNINMEEAYRVLNTYDLKRQQPGKNTIGTPDVTMADNNSLPVAEPVVDRFVEEYKANHPLDDNQTKYSIPSKPVLEDMIRYSMSRPDSIEGLSAEENEKLRSGLRRESTIGTAERQWGREGAQETDELDPRVKEWIAEHNKYFPDTNADQLNRAIRWVRENRTQNDKDGYNTSVQKVLSKNFNYRTADGQARMIAVMAMAAAKDDVYAQAALAEAYDQQGTDLGRALQARKLFRLMTPAGRVQTIQKMLQNVHDELAARGKDVDLKLSDWVLRAAAVAESEGDYKKVRDAAAQELAEQLPANWKDRIRSLRMLAMLGNTRTHVRNFIGNALFVPAVGLKNKLSAVGETISGQEVKTKTLSPFLRSDVREFARQDAIKMKDELTGEAKWNEINAVERAQKPFTGFIQKLIDFNGDMLEREDWFFLKGHYRRALGGWIQANNYSIEQLQNSPSLLEEGRAYAIEEAQKATYRDFNKLAQTLNQVSRQGGVAGFVVDAVLPFKKTPANILRRGIEYSPIGIAKSLTTNLYHLKQYQDYEAGKLSTLPDKAITPNQFIDNLCSGLTGTAIMAVGALLSSLGIVTVGLDDDDDKFDKERGNQEYSIKILGTDVTYTMDWAAPMSMPFFVGAAIQNQMAEEKENFDVGDLVNDLSYIAEPVFNLSMLDGVNTLFETSQYDDTNTITQIGGKIVSNYITSYIPSMLGAATRSFDPVRRKAFVKSGEGGGLLGTFRYAIEQTENKIPVLSQTNIPYRNAFGEADESSIVEKLFENFISPGYIQAKKNDPVIDELERLYNSTGVNDASKSDLVPKLPNKSVGGVALEAEQYDQVTVQRGQTAKKLLDELMNTDYYKRASDQDRATMVADVWTFATQTANNAAVGRKLDTWVLNSQTNPVQGIINRNKTAVVNETRSGWKAEAVLAVESEDYEALDVCIEALKEAGVKDAKSSVKSAISSAYKTSYVLAYQRGDYGRMLEIEDILENTGLFKESDFAKWLDDMNKQISDEEEI